LAIFGRVGYKKASVGDIADAAGIAKGMITYYFGSKKNLYLYLCEMSMKIVAEEFHRHYIPGERDFFEKLRQATQAKVAAVKQHRGITAFLACMYVERDADVVDEVATYIQQGLDMRNQMMLGDIDLDKFHDNADPAMVERFLMWTSKGMADDIELLDDSEKIEEFAQEFYKFLDLMKTAFYK